MFENLTDKLQRAFKTLRGQGTLTEENIGEALREIRVALLEADVNLNVVPRPDRADSRQGRRALKF
jgi:signal recognition particle subunit SRP54